MADRAPAAGLVTVDAPGAVLAVPAGWDVLTDVEPGTVLVAVEPSHDGFRANLTLTRTPLRGMGFRDWQVGTDVLLADTLTRYQVLDLERLTVAGHPGGRRLAHHVTASEAAVVLEQWCVAVDDLGWALTSTVDVARHDELTDVVAACAATLRLTPGATS